MRITINMYDGEKFFLQVELEQTLAQAIWLADIIVEKLTLPALCLGLGLCGQCKVRFVGEAPIAMLDEKKYFSPEELENGWRLSCLHKVNALQNDIEIELSCDVKYLNKKCIPNNFVQDQDNKCIPNNFAKYQDDEPHYLAIDLGTSSICWQVQDCNGNIKARGVQINPQMGAGSEVMSRLLYAQSEQGSDLLKKRILIYIQKHMQISSFNISEICIAANSVMTYILLQKNLSTLSKAPYSLTYVGDKVENIFNLPPIYIPPLLAPFVGGDVSAGIIHIQETLKPEYPYILVDLGTNAELVLALDNHNSVITSVPLGPALEGIGLSCGCIAQIGSVAKFSLTQKGLLPFVLQDANRQDASRQDANRQDANRQDANRQDANRQESLNQLDNVMLSSCADYKEIKGMCATAYFSLIHILLQINILSRDGTFCRNPVNPLAKNLSNNLKEIKGQLCLSLPYNLYLSASDVEEILKVKAAFSVALTNLLKKSNVQLTDIKSFFIAGALGEHMDNSDFEVLGFLPYGFANRLHIIGNSSLKGAALLLKQKNLRQKLHVWSKGCELLELTADDNFTEQYLQHMNFN